MLGIKSYTKETRLTVTGENLIKFKRLISLTPAKANRILDVPRTSADCLPETVTARFYADIKSTSPRMKARTTEAREVCRRLRDAGIFSPDIGGRATRIHYSDLDKTIDLLKGTYAEGRLDDIKAHSHLRFMEVTSKELFGQEPVYDLTVEGDHNYIANGMSVHNSNNCWIFVATKATRENEIINVEQLKARNGRLFDFTLSAKLDIMRIGDLDIEEKEKYVQEKKERQEKRSKGKDKDTDKSEGKKSKSNKSREEDSEGKKKTRARAYLSDLADGDDDD